MIKPGCVALVSGRLAIITSVVHTISQTNIEQYYYSGYWFDGYEFTDAKNVVFEAYNIEEWHNKELIRDRDLNPYNWRL
jgi:hypothetical protein